MAFFVLYNTRCYAKCLASLFHTMKLNGYWGDSFFLTSLFLLLFGLEKHEAE